MSSFSLCLHINVKKTLKERPFSYEHRIRIVVSNSDTAKSFLIISHMFLCCWYLYGLTFNACILYTVACVLVPLTYLNIWLLQTNVLFENVLRTFKLHRENPSMFYICSHASCSQPQQTKSLLLAATIPRQQSSISSFRLCSFVSFLNECNTMHVSV